MCSLKVPEEVICQAEKFSHFRALCKDYLTKNHHCYNKFTITPNDSKLGYISEHVIKDYFIANNCCVCTWEDGFDKTRISKILDTGSRIQDDIEFVKKYFYDEFDLIVNGTKLDIKTALTEKNPNGTWDFSYPKIQADKHSDEYKVIY